MTEEQYKKMFYSNVEDAYEEKDAHGVYRSGVYRNGTTSIIVEHGEGGWYMKLHSKNPIGMVELASYRRTFVPEDVSMAYIVEPVVDRNNIYTMFEVHAR